MDDASMLSCNKTLQLLRQG